MRFGSPTFFWLLLALPVMIAFFIWSWQARQRALGSFAQTEIARRLTQSSTLARQVLRWSILLACVFMLVLALVQPRFGVKAEMVERKGIDVIVALDVSRSMLAQDIAPNRIDRAKHEIGKFIDMLRGDRVGIIVFAAKATYSAHSLSIMEPRDCSLMR